MIYLGFKLDSLNYLGTKVIVSILMIYLVTYLGTNGAYILTYITSVCYTHPVEEGHLIRINTKYVCKFEVCSTE